jgi:hypothetical protein
MSFDNADVACMDSSIMINEEDEKQIVYKSPFLIDKHIQRDEIAFEYYTLVQSHNENRSQNPSDRDFSDG